MDKTNFHSLYGESISKTFLPPVRIYALIGWEGQETTTTNLGLDKRSRIKIYFHKRRLTEDQNLFVREGDFILYGKFHYEILDLNEPKQLFGQVDYKYEIMANCVRARKGTFDAY